MCVFDVRMGKGSALNGAMSLCRTQACEAASQPAQLTQATQQLAPHQPKSGGPHMIPVVFQNSYGNVVVSCSPKHVNNGHNYGRSGFGFACRNIAFSKYVTWRCTLYFGSPSHVL